MKIKPKAKSKPRNTKAYYHWLIVEQPKRKKRLPQLNKHYKRLAKVVGDSELVAISKKFSSLNY